MSRRIKYKGWNVYSGHDRCQHHTVCWLTSLWLCFRDLEPPFLTEFWDFQPFLGQKWGGCVRENKMQGRKCIYWSSAMSGPHFGWVNFTLIVFYRPWAAIFDDFYRFSVIFGPKMRFLGLEKQNPWVVLIWTLPQGPGPHCKLINFTFVGFCGPWVVIKYEIYQKTIVFGYFWPENTVSKAMWSAQSYISIVQLICLPTISSIPR